MPVNAATLQVILLHAKNAEAAIAIVAAIDAQMSADNPPKSADGEATVRRQVDVPRIDDAAERRRERDRQRQREKRAKEKVEAEARKASGDASTDVRGQSADNPPTMVPPVSSLSSSPIPPITNPSSSPSERELSLPVDASNNPPEFDLEPPPGMKREKLQGEMLEAFAIWNETAGDCGLPKAQVLTSARKANLQGRLKDCGGLDGWRDAMAKIREAPHLLGQNDRGWRADLDFVLRKDKFVKLMEGGYVRHTGQATRSAGVDHADLANWVREREEDPRYDERGQ